MRKYQEARWHHKKSGAEHSIQRHSSSPTGLSGGCAKPIFDHAHERSAKRQGERGLILCPLSSNLPYRSRRVELRLQQRRKTEEAGFELSVPRDPTKVLKTPEVASAWGRRSQCRRILPDHPYPVQQHQ